MYRGLSAVIGSWKMYATSAPRVLRSKDFLAPTISTPLTFTLPETRALDANRSIKPIAIEVFPEPDSPTIARTFPACTSKFISIAAGYQTPSTQKSMLNLDT